MFCGISFLFDFDLAHTTQCFSLCFQSHCNEWWNLRALDWHFESQCIPTPLAYFAAQFPSWWQALSVALTFTIEIAVPFGIFLPTASVRWLVFWLQVLFQVSIMLTGNYTFFNLLTASLCISLIPKSPSAKRKSSKLMKLLSAVVFTGFVFALVAGTVHFFSLKWIDGTVASKIAFTKEQFALFLTYSVPAGCALGALFLILAILRQLRAESHSKMAFLRSTVTGGLACLLFSMTLIRRPITVYPQPLKSFISGSMCGN